MMLTIQSLKDVTRVYTPGWFRSPHPMPHERTPETNKILIIITGARVIC